MKLRVLGCAGGIGGRSARTTAFLVDHDILIDCGTGAGELEVDELARVDHIFVTHAHLDHVALIPLMLDSVGEMRRAPLIVHASPETIRILRSHIFNWLVWPDFTAIPDRHQPFLRFNQIRAGETVRLGARAITALPAHHTVPALSYCLDSGDGQLVYSGDTAYSRDFIAAVNGLDRLRHLVIETAFPDEQHGLALASRHLCPKLLAAVLDEIEVSPEVHVTHLKPGQGQRIMTQLAAYRGRLCPRALQHGQILEF